MPLDTWLIAEHKACQTGEAAPYYFAHKTDAGWQFGAATPDGWLLPGDPHCAKCHSEATADFVFGFPRTVIPAANEQRPDGG
jgi:hypothetical protein